ncbi:MAG: ABC transporter ATP-binding protein [Sedimentisphaerales bacterium]|nr:ABC transporter ATP-binding protein [Sedimentisphaerales bacterium]
MAEVTLENVKKIYGRNPEVLAVKDVSLHIQDREFFVFLGPSGCGKTTTLRMIAGLEEISGGTIYFDKKTVNDLTPQKRNVSMAFENYALYPTLSVWENIAFPLKIRKWNNDTIRKKMEWVAGALQIGDILHKKPFELSGGQQQRVSLARAIVREAEVFLFDEPLSHLDMKQRQLMRAEIKRINKDLQNTMIYVTHDQKEAMALADRIAVMNDGKLQQVGTPFEIYENPVNEFVAGFIGEPPMNFLNCQILRLNDFFELILKKQVIAKIHQSRLPNQELFPQFVRVGIRPKRIQITNSENKKDALQAAVIVYESIGEKGILKVQLLGEPIYLITEPNQKFSKGENIHLSFPIQYLFFFNPETGERINLK